MTDPTKPGAEPHGSEKPIHDNPMADSPAMDAPAHEDMAPDPITILEAAHDAALKEAATMKDRALRTLAEMENLRKRTEREVADAKVYGVTSFARDLLSVADAVRRAFESIPADTVTDGPLKAFFEGIALTESELLKVLAKHGVKKVEPDGMKFDPNLHQAMFEVPNPDVPSGTVVQTVQAGYTIGDRVLRPALVGVSKGGPKAAPQTSSASPA